MIATLSGPTADELLMIEYQETVFQQIADRYHLPLSEVGVIAATFLAGLNRRELAEVRKVARIEYQAWVEDEAAPAWAS